jgi:hypothetical protein
MFDQIRHLKPPSPLPPSKQARQDVKALEVLAKEFQIEGELHGITPEGAAKSIHDFGALLGLSTNH